MKKDFKLGALFYIALVFVILLSASLLIIISQEELIDEACAEIENNNNSAAIEYIDNIFIINMCGLSGENVLMTACRTGNLEMFKYVVQKGANVNYNFNGKHTPLELFCNSGYEAGPEMLKAMLSAGCHQSKFSVKPAIFYLADNYYWMNDKQKEIATEETLLLLQYGAPLGYGDTSILHLAAKGDMDDLFYTVIHTRLGLSMINMKDGDGNTPWQVAVKNGAVGVQRVIRDLEREAQQAAEEERRQEELLNGEYDGAENDTGDAFSDDAFTEVDTYYVPIDNYNTSEPNYDNVGY